MASRYMPCLQMLLKGCKPWGCDCSAARGSRLAEDGLVSGPSCWALRHPVPGHPRSYAALELRASVMFASMTAAAASS